MANISQYLNEILNAVYGEEVRSSIYNAIDIINKVGEKTLTLGTAVSSSTSPVSGFYQDSVYINTNTWDVWKCNGSSWVFQQNLLGSSITKVEKTGSKSGTNNLVDIYGVYTDNNVKISEFEVSNGSNISLYTIDDSVVVGVDKKDGSSNSVFIRNGSVIASGTVVTSETSPRKDGSRSFYNRDIYINTDDWKVWSCVGDKDRSSIGTSWSYIGTIKPKDPASVRVYKGDINGHAKTGAISTCDLSKIYPSENVLVGDILIAQWDTTNTTEEDYKDYSVMIEFWEITGISDSTVTVKGITEYGIEAGTDVSISKTDNVVTITSSNTKGTTTVTVKDGLKIGSGRISMGPTHTSTIDDIDYYEGDTFISTSDGTVWRCTGKDTWSYIGSIKGDSGSMIFFYKGTADLTDNDVNISSDDLYPWYSTSTIRIGDVILDFHQLSDTSENSVRVDLREVTGVSYPSGAVKETTAFTSLAGRTYIKTGETGPRGTSIKSVSQISKSGRTSTYKVLLENDDSAGTFEVMDGEQGIPGVSPSVSVSKAGIVTTVTITDATGDHQFQIKDGESGSGTGDMLKSVYDTDGDGVIDMNSIPLATDEDIRAIIAARDN